MPSDLASFGKGIDLSLQALVPLEERRALIQAAANDLLADAAREISGQRGDAWRPQESLPEWIKTSLGRSNPDRGTVTVHFEQQGVPTEVVEDVLAMLVDNSPVLTGAYRASHRVYADKQDVTGALPDGERGAAVQEFTIMPTVEYGRKLERLFGVYEGVTAVAQRRFGNRVAVFFEFRSPILPYVPGGRNRAERAAIRRQPNRRAAMKAERQTRVPCIFIRPLGG